MIYINNNTAIPEQEIRYMASRSAGPGGQHVNTSSTRVELLFDIDASPSLTDEQKRLVMQRLSNRISKDGILRVVSQETRSQKANRDLAMERFMELLSGALRKPSVRKRTRTPLGSKRRRLEQKRKKSRLKQQRTHREFSATENHE